MKYCKAVSCGIAALILMTCAAAPAAAQEYRGQISGRVLDPSGAAVPGAHIVVTNLSKNSPSSTVSNEAGAYNVLYLSPGNYAITVTAPGFKKLERTGIEVRVGDNLALDLQLTLGGTQEVVQVIADAALLETTTASVGVVVDQKRISELPLSDGNPFTLHRFMPGVTNIGDLKFSRPFDNAGSSDIRADGAPGVNEFTLDGSPNMASGGRVAFVPPSDVVQEFKVGTASFDAQDGHTAGASVNVSLKSGTNNLHGTLYEFVRNDKLSANDFFLNRGGQPRAQLRYNRYGGTVGGPVWLPKIYNGKNRTFFFFGFEGIKDRFPEPTQETVPTAAERGGDFSALLQLGSQYQIYDPLTAVKLSNGRIQRQPFAGNIIKPERISPIALNYLKYYPLPNQAGDSQGRNNYLSPQVRGDDFHSEMYRFDHQLTDKQHLFFRYTHNWRRESRSNWSGVTNGIHATGNYLFRINNGGTFDHVYTINPTTVLNYRVGFQRFLENNVRQFQAVMDPATLGFSKDTVALFGGEQSLPRFDISPFSLLADALSGPTAHNIYSFQPTLTKFFGGSKHQVRMGYDFRAYRENAYSLGNAAGSYTFGTGYTRGPLDNSTAAPIGQDFAAMLLGQPTGGSIDRNAQRSNQTVYHGVFFQDDWKVNSRLTLNLGLRWEYEGPVTERYERNILTVDLVTANPIEAAAKAAYAANPIPQIPSSDFKVKGGYIFVSSDHRGIWNADKNNFQPRIGMAYRLANKTVLRAGWAIYTVPFVISGVRQDGFSQATSIVPSNDTGLTFVANLYNPWPSGVANPPGSSLGLSTYLGRSLNMVALDRKNPQAMRWEVSIQRELPGRWVVDVAYVGNHGYDLNASTAIFNTVPRQYLSTSPERDQTTIDSLTANVANPFRGLFDATTSLGSGSNTQRQQLLRPYPEFTGITGERNDGTSSYNSAQLRVEKRFGSGFTLLTSYTFSKWLRRTDFLNESDTKYDRRLDDSDVPHRIALTGIWELPFGKGRRFGRSWHGVVEGILGGWQAQGIYQAQTGRPLLFGTQYILRTDYSTVALSGKDRTVDRWFNSDGFEKASGKQLANNVRTALRVIPGVRGHGLNLCDLSVIKNISITERVKFQLRGEFLNAFNHAQFNTPSVTPTASDFGKVTSQANLARNVQIGMKLVF